MEQASRNASSSEGKREVISGVSPCPGERSKGWTPKMQDAWSKPSVLANSNPSASPMPWVETELVFKITVASLSEKNRCSPGATSMLAASTRITGRSHSSNKEATVAASALSRSTQRSANARVPGNLPDQRETDFIVAAQVRTQAHDFPIGSRRRRNRPSRQIPRPACARNRRCRDRRPSATSPYEESAPLWTYRGAFWARTPSCPVPHC